MTQLVEPIEIDDEFKEEVDETLSFTEEEKEHPNTRLVASRRNPAIFMREMVGAAPYYWQAYAMTRIGKAIRREIDTRKFAILTSRQIGKAQPYDEPVLTPNGWKEMGELEVGDEVIAEDGSPTRVTNIFEQGLCDTYKVTFTDGSSTRCNKEHLWKYKGAGCKYWQTDTLQSIIDRKGGMNPTSDQGIRIPIVQPVEFPEKSHDIHPYTLGALIGDGGLSSNSIRFSQKEEDVVTHIDEVDGIVSLDKIQGDGSWSVKPGQRVKHILDKYDLDVTSEDKYIPDDWLYDSVENRKALLRGLMDTDGSIYGKCQTEYYSVSKQLAKDVKELVQSLGGTAKIVEKPSWYKDDEGNKQHCKMCYRVRITFYDFNPFYIERKADKWYEIRYKRTRILDSIEHVGQDKQRCIKVDHPSSTYITDDYIVTHNSTLLSNIALWATMFNHAPHGVHGSTKVGSFSMSNAQAKKLMREIKKWMRSGDYHMRQEIGADDFFTGLLDKHGENNKTTVTLEAHDPSLHGDLILDGAKVGPEIRTYAPTFSVLGETFSLGFVDEAAQVDDEFYDEVFRQTMNAADGVSLFTSTPWSSNGFFYEMIKNHDEMDVEVLSFTVDALKAEEGHKQAEIQMQSVSDEIQSMEARGKYDTIQRQYYCEFVQSTDQYFDPDIVDEVFTSALNKKESLEEPVDVGIDFGGSASSHTVVTVSRYDEESDRVERVWHKRYDVQGDLTLLRDLKLLHEKFDIQRIMAEECPQGDHYIQKMKKKLGWNVVEVNPSREKARLYSGFDNKMRRGEVFSYEDDLLKEEMKALEREETRRTTKIHAPRNYTDDMIDSWVLSCYNYINEVQQNTRSLFDRL